MRLLLVLLFLAGGVSAASTVPLTIQSDRATLIGRSADHYLDRSGQLDIAAASQSSEIAFTPADGRVPSYGVRPTPNAAVWMRVAIPKLESNERDWTLYLDASRIRAAQLFLPTSAGWTQLEWTYKATDGVASDRLRFPAFTVEKEEISERVVFFRFEAVGSMRGLLWLSSRAQFLNDYSDESLWFGLLFGITLGLFAYTLSMGIALRESSLIAVALLTLTYFLYVFADRGFFETSFFRGATSLSRLFSYSGTFAIYASWLMFQLLYLRTSLHFPRLARLYEYTVGLCALFALWAAIEVALDSFPLRKYSALIGIVIIAFQFFLAAALFRKERRRVLSFLLCWTPAIIGGSGRLFADLFPGLGASPALLNPTYLGPLLSIFLFAMMASLDIQLRERLLRTAMETSQERFRNFADSASDSFWETDREGVLTFQSGPTSVAAGLELGHRLIDRLRSVAGPAGRATLQSLEGLLSRGQPFRGVNIELAGAGGEPRYLAFSGAPIVDELNDFAGYRGIAADVSAEITRQERDAQQQKMAAIGHLAGSIAHEINNLLHPIINLSRRVAGHLNSSDESRRYLDIVAEAGVRASEIVTGILSSVRPEISTHQKLPFDEAVKRALDGLRPILPVGISLQSNIEAHSSAQISFGEVFQVLSNLIGNAIYATGGAGCIRVSLVPGSFENGLPCSELAVADDGAGMDSATKHRVFEPFFTTKEPGKGTGLGLSIVYGIVHRWNGKIDVDSERGMGTRIVIRTPQTIGIE